jgi:poly(3-hydroxyalkanoate) depolymerase
VSVEHSVTVGVGGAEIRAAVRPGTGDGTPLLLCNGIGAAHDSLRPLVDALDPLLTVVRFDVPGAGASPSLRLPRPYAAIAWTAARMMSQLGHRRFDVLGISWGGGLAQQIAFQHPRRCRRVVLAATAPGWMMVPAASHVLRHMVTPGRYRDAEYARAVAGLLYGGAVRENPQLAKALLVDTDRPPSRLGYVHQLLAGAGWTSLPFLPAIRQPTLVLAGTDDPIIPLANARMMTKLLPHARLHTYDDGHLALITDAATHAPVVSAFLLDEHPNPRSAPPSHR